MDAMFRAFSDRTRLRILHLLLPGELCVCHIVGVLDLPQPKISRHLAYLRRWTWCSRGRKACGITIALRRFAVNFTASWSNA